MNAAAFSRVNVGHICGLNAGQKGKEAGKAERRSGVKVNIKVAARLRYATRLPRFSLLKNGQAGSGLY